jgi:hypothetical protein
VKALASVFNVTFLLHDVSHRRRRGKKKLSRAARSRVVSVDVQVAERRSL